MKHAAAKPLAVLLACLLSASPAMAGDELAVLPAEHDGTPKEKLLTEWLKSEAFRALDARRADYEEIETPEELAAWQERVRAGFIERLGGFPERTPLNPRVVGTIEADGYTIEKVVYESQPRHFVTAVLYLPEGEGPFPGVVIPSGHSSTAKAAGYNQRVAVVLARHGIAALSYDPIGQGERHQLLDAEGEPRYRSTTEHTLLGAGSIPVGRSTATYRIWDGVRSIDYLVSCEEVDPERIGVTGCSGGGTLTSYLMTVDERVACAAPSCYVTSFRRLIETIGPQDAEQNVFGQIAAGIDHADYVIARAPKPTLLLASTHDFFDIGGTWDSFRQAKRAYTRLGFPERVDLVETDTDHGYPRGQREGMLRWMLRWLADTDEPAEQSSPVETQSVEALRCTPKGETLLLEGARSVVDLNVGLAEGLAAERSRRWKPENREAALAEVRRIAGIRPFDELPELAVERTGRLDRDGYRIEKYVLRADSPVPLPALLFVPEETSGERCLYLHGAGKHADAGAGGPIAERLGRGEIVLAVDLRGIGETGGEGDNLWGGDWDQFFLSYLLGRSLVGMRAEDTLAAARFLSLWDRAQGPKPVELVAVGRAGPPALHAAALERGLFGSLTLRRSLRSWSDVVRNPGAGGQLAGTVHGALEVYDLPDLIGSLPEGFVAIEQPVTLEDE